MRIRETPERLVLETTLPEFLLVGTPLQAHSVVFDRIARSVQIRQGFLRKTSREIPFAQVRRVRHWMVADSYAVFGDKLDGHYAKMAFPLEPNALELSLELYDQGKEVLYRRGLRMKREGRDGRDVIPFVQKMADRISAFTGIPGVIVADEIQGSLDCGSKGLILHGECLPHGLKGTVIPFDEIRALRATKTAKGYHAVEICRKVGGDILANEGFDSTSRLHETVKMIAACAGIPFELQETVTSHPLHSRPYKPISPTSRG